MHAASAFYPQLSTGQPTAQAGANHQQAKLSIKGTAAHCPLGYGVVG